MSNRRRLKPSGPDARERCSACARRVGRLDDALRLRTGQVICPRCQQNGELPRLACGHVALPGTLMITDSTTDNFQCPQCSPVAAQYGNQRLGMGRRP